MSSLRGKVVVITGASAGIGAASAVRLASCGASLVLHGRNEANLKTVVEKCVAEGLDSEQIVTVLGDLSLDSTVDDIIKTTMQKFDRIDVLFNNAGFISMADGPTGGQGTVETLDEMYRIFMRVPYMLVEGFSAELIKTKGVIINCSSGYSIVPDPTVTGYCAMKAAMDHYTKTLALEFGMKGVRVNSVNPGYVKTSVFRGLGDAAEPFWESRNELVPLEQKIPTAEEIANVVMFLASDQSTCMTGAIVMCDKAISLASPVVDFTQFK